MKITTIKLSQKTRDKLASLDFVRKQSFDEIVTYLIEIYEKRRIK